MHVFGTQRHERHALGMPRLAVVVRVMPLMFESAEMQRSLPCNRRLLFQTALTEIGGACSRAAVRRCGAFMAKICDVVPQQPKALDRSGDLAKTKVGYASGGQSGVGPTKFSTEEFPRDRVRRGADRGDTSSCVACLWR